MAEKPAALPALLLVLTITTGLIDAVSVLGLGRVFTANMTGNIVFLGFALAGVPGYSARRSLAALAAFLVAAVIGGRLGTRLDASRRRWLLTVAFVESGVLFAAALAASGYDRETLAPVARLYTLIVLTAVAMGVRNATAPCSCCRWGWYGRSRSSARSRCSRPSLTSSLETPAKVLER